MCGDRVVLLGAVAYLSPALSKAVHKETGKETGPDGHLVVPVDVNPAEAGQVTAR
jgi:hypothetical protein